MNNLHDLKKRLVDYLTPKFAPHAEITEEYPAMQRDSHAGCSLPVIGVGIEQVKAAGAGGSNFLGAAQGKEQFGRALDITLRFTICSPHSAGQCHQLFTTLCQALLLEKSPLPVSGLWCDALVYDKLAGGFVLAAKASLPALLAAGDNAHDISEFSVRSVKECPL